VLSNRLKTAKTLPGGHGDHRWKLLELRPQKTWTLPNSITERDESRLGYLRLLKRHLTGLLHDLTKALLVLFCFFVKTIS
jgi:hypothetical protein